MLKMTSPQNKQTHNRVGRVQVYTGEGKGKTTAALGLAIRAVGAGLRVWFGQFVKGMEYSEIRALRRFDDLITVRQFGCGCFIEHVPDKIDIQAGRKGLEEAKRILLAGAHEVVILDEANIATYFGLFTVKDLCELIDQRPAHVELVITGRYADRPVVEKADLVTDMKELKHYYNNGLIARDGIER